jgi:hypothetical protein
MIYSPLIFLFSGIILRSAVSFSSDTFQWEHFYLTEINISLSSYETLLNTSMKSFPSHSTSSPFSPTSHPSLCVYDPIRIAWNTSRINPTSVHLAFIVNREWDGYSTPLSLIPLPNTTIPINPIQCDLNEDHCVLNIKEVFVKDKKLYLEFNHPTNQPELLSTSRLNVRPRQRAPSVTIFRRLCQCIRPSRGLLLVFGRIRHS